MTHIPDDALKAALQQISTGGGVLHGQGVPSHPMPPINTRPIPPMPSNPGPIQRPEGYAAAYSSASKENVMQKLSTSKNIDEIHFLCEYMLLNNWITVSDARRLVSSKLSEEAGRRFEYMHNNGDIKRRFRSQLESFMTRSNMAMRHGMHMQVKSTPTMKPERHMPVGGEDRSDGTSRMIRKITDVTEMGGVNVAEEIQVMNSYMSNYVQKPANAKVMLVNSSVLSNKVKKFLKSTGPTVKGEFIMKLAEILGQHILYILEGIIKQTKFRLNLNSPNPRFKRALGMNVMPTIRESAKNDFEVYEEAAKRAREQEPEDAPSNIERSVETRLMDYLGEEGCKDAEMKEIIREKTVIDRKRAETPDGKLSPEDMKKMKQLKDRFMQISKVNSNVILRDCLYFLMQHGRLPENARRTYIQLAMNQNINPTIYEQPGGSRHSEYIVR